MIEDIEDNKSIENSPCPAAAEWEDGLFDCCSSPHHLMVAIFLPCASGSYIARAIRKFPIVLGALIGAFYAGAIGCAALTVVNWDDDADNTIGLGGLEIRKMMFGAIYAGMHFLIAVFLLRGWMRTFYGIKGSKCADLPVSCLFSWCALAQMSKHVAKSKARASDITTLPAYSA